MKSAVAVLRNCNRFNVTSFVTWVAARIGEERQCTRRGLLSISITQRWGAVQRERSALTSSLTLADWENADVIDRNPEIPTQAMCGLEGARVANPSTCAPPPPAHPVSRARARPPDLLC